MKALKRIIRRIFGLGLNLEDTLQFLKANGAEIGCNQHYYGGDILIDTQFPFMLHIGNDVEITKDVHILNHDYAWSVLKKKTGYLYGGVGPVYIGDNVFIGQAAIILKNSYIGNNCIVGAGSIVSGHFPDNVVIAGNPAKIICSIDEFCERRKRKQLEEAVCIVKCYRRAFGKDPQKDKLPAYFWLFEPRNRELDSPVFIQRMKLKGNYELSMRLFQETQPLFDCYETFLKSIPWE